MNESRIGIDSSQANDTEDCSMNSRDTANIPLRFYLSPANAIFENLDLPSLYEAPMKQESKKRI